MSFTETPEPVTVRPVRQIGEFTAMVVIEEVTTDDMEITQHPVQEGATISDHAYLKPINLTIRASFGDDEMPLDELYKKLLDFQAIREPFDVVTGKRIFKNMLVKTLAQTTDHTSENVLAVLFTLQEVIIVNVEVATVPPRAKQKTPGRTGGTQNAGAKSAKSEDSKSGPKKQKSILASIAGK